MFVARQSISSALRRTAGLRPFYSSTPAFVKVGDAIPDVELMENSPGNRVSIAKELKGKGLIIGVPAAFSELFSVYSSLYACTCCKRPIVQDSIVGPENIYT